MSFHDLNKIPQSHRDKHIDRVLALMAYGIDQEFEVLFGEWNSTTSFSYFATLSKSVHDEMVYEKLITSQKRERKGKTYHIIRLTVEGNRIKQAGGWIKHKKKNRPPLTSNRWFTIAGWVIATAASAIAVVQLFWKPIDAASELQRQDFINNNRPKLELSTSAFYGTDPLLTGTNIEDTIGITGSYWVKNSGKSNITLEEAQIPKDLTLVAYFTDRVIKLPYTLNPDERILIACKLKQGNIDILKTETALKSEVKIACSHPFDIRYLYKFTWDPQAGRFTGSVRANE